MQSKSFDTAQLKENINLIDLAGRYVELRKATPNEYHGPCPWCGGSDRFRVRADFFACRQCGQSGDAIAFVMKQQNVDFKGAVAILGGDMSMIATDKIKPIVKPATATTAYVWDEPKQRREALEAHGKLLAGTSKQAKIALDYLAGRKIEQDTIKAFSIGYDAIGLPNTWDKVKRERCYPMQVAVSLPWFNHDGALQCVKYRFAESHTYTDLGGKERTENKTSRGSWSGHMFGWQALQGPDKRKVLIITEGEMNALSLWQVGNQWIDVLSAGSEGGIEKLPTVVTELANRYAHRIVWADKGGIANKAALSIGAASMRSPGEMDANDLLQAGKLAPLLDYMLKRLGVDTKATDSLTDSPGDSPVNQVERGAFADLTELVGQTITPATWAALQVECERRYGGTMVFDVDKTDGGVLVKRLTPAKPIVGTAETVSIYETDPVAYLGKVVAQKEMDILLERARLEGFDIRGEWMSDTWPCDWRVVKVVNGEVVHQA